MAGVGQVVGNDAFLHVREGLPQCFMIGKDDERGQRHEDPRPGPHGIMHDVEQQRGARRMALVFGGQHALGNVAAAAGLGPRVPHRPPLHGERNEKDGNEHVQVARVGDQVEFLSDGLVL